MIGKLLRIFDIAIVLGITFLVQVFSFSIFSILVEHLLQSYKNFSFFFQYFIVKEVSAKYF